MASPARQQYLDLKQRYQDAILLYRLGDFYETFDDDARLASQILGIQLTARTYPRGEGRVPMAGVPHHSIESYIRRLLEAGHRVALCEQMSEPGKGLVDRDVVRVFSPGTVVEAGMLDPDRSNYLVAVGSRKDIWALALLELTTSEFQVTEFKGPGAKAEVEAELLRLNPAECLVSAEAEGLEIPDRARRTTREVDWHNATESGARLRRHLQVGSLAGFGLDGFSVGVTAAAAIIAYLEHSNPRGLDQVRTLRSYDPTQFMVLDRFTRSSLELVPNRSREGSGWTLFRVLDKTQTPMGRRRLLDIIGRPLRNLTDINKRLDGIESLMGSQLLLNTLSEQLAGLGDIERTLTRILQGKATGELLFSLHASLAATGTILRLLEAAGLEKLTAGIDPCPELTEVLQAAIDGETESGIRVGYDQELDAARYLVENTRSAIAALEQSESLATGIKSLRVGFNKVFGYYFEVGKSHSERVPERFVRQQTLVNAERYFTPEIKELEARILAAKDETESREHELIAEIVSQIASSRERIGQTGRALAELDAVHGLARVALTNRYCRPSLSNDGNLQIVRGRHPVVEVARSDEPFVPNDCCFDDSTRIIVLTGPNMGGKSTTLRMVALITLMAQIGSFVPAEKTNIGIVDRIFSRVGAQDDIAAGQSTFMTEMVETSNILHHATDRSLLVLDEIGRGTSTYDGLAIARAVVEHIHTRLGARTLFATHYQELTALEDELDTVRNFHMEVTEHDGAVVFLHRIEPGGADRSYGIHVARLAGLPHSVTVRADRLLRQLEKNGAVSHATGPQLALFRDPDLTPKSEVEEVAIRILDELLALDLGNTTPLQALEQLHSLQEKGRASR